MLRFPTTYRSQSQKHSAVVPSHRTASANGHAIPQQKPTAGEAQKPTSYLQSSIPPPIITALDKPDSPEYKKKRAIINGPILELTTENSMSYGKDVDPFTAMKDIFEALAGAHSRTGVVSPQYFLEVFKNVNDMFRAAMHQDAHEFYGLLLNHVITAIDQFSRQELARQEGKTFDLSNQRAWDPSRMPMPGSPGTTWLHDIFESVMTSETRCLTCETVSQRDETFLDISIDLENHSSVTACLQKFSAEEMLRETNKFHCDQCGSLQEAEKRIKIKKLPRILTLHLKRFKYTDDLQRLQKLFDTVVYPSHLRMFNTTADAEDPDRLYELYAVVVHIGANAYHGHYISVIKTQDRGWLLFDDEMVEPVDKNYVKNFFGDKPGQACAYLLFYQETTIEAVKREQEAEGTKTSTSVPLDSDNTTTANGTHPSSISKAVNQPGTPIEDRANPLANIPSIPPPPPPASEKPLPIRSPTSPTSPGVLPNNFSSAFPRELSPKPFTKEEKEREKRNAKEAEKARKALEKERAKEQEKQRKDLEQQKKEQERMQAEEAKRAMAHTKQNPIGDEQKNKYEGLGNIGMYSNGSAGDTIVESSKEKDKESRFGFGSLTRNSRGNRSVSRKGFSLWSGNRSASNAHQNSTQGLMNGKISGEYAVIEENVSGDHESVPQPQPQQPLASSPIIDKIKPKERFSFSGLGRKKSRDLLGG